MIRDMETNYTHATLPERDPVPAYAHEVVALLNHVEAVEDEIGALIGDTERSVNAKLSDRHREIGTALKVADIYSNLAIAEAIDKLRAAQAPMQYRGDSAYYLAGDPHR